MQDFVGILKRIGILSALQVAALAIPFFIFKDNSTSVAIAQLLGVLFITWLAYAAGYRSGSREEPLKSTDE